MNKDEDLEDLRELADWFKSRGQHLTANFLHRIADQYEAATLHPPTERKS